MRNYRPIAISSRDKLNRLLFEMINLFAFIIFICSACLALASERELGHPLCRTFTAHDYVEGLGQICAITEDPHCPILFGCEGAILVFDNTRWDRRAQRHVVEAMLTAALQTPPPKPSIRVTILFRLKLKTAMDWRARHGG